MQSFSHTHNHFYTPAATSIHLRFAGVLSPCTFIQDNLTNFVFLRSSIRELMISRPTFYMYKFVYIFNRWLPQGCASSSC